MDVTLFENQIFHPKTHILRWNSILSNEYQFWQLNSTRETPHIILETSTSTPKTTLAPMFSEHTLTGPSLDHI